MTLVTRQTLKAEKSDKKRNFSLEQIKTYNLIKGAVWNCVIMDGESNLPKEQQKVELVLLRDLMKEL